MIRMIVNGSAGRMGRAVKAEILSGNYPACLAGEADVQNGTRLADLSVSAHVAIDFSVASAAEETLACCAEKGWNLLLAVTGELPRQAIEKASEKIAVLTCPNVSLGAEALRRLAALADSLLGEEYDRVVAEVHHRQKKDAPSGTAKVLLEAMENPNKQVISLRAGQVPGTHRVLFYGPYDTLEITHTAFDRRLFAAGAVKAACWLASCAPGLYDIRDYFTSCES